MRCTYYALAAAALTLAQPAYVMWLKAPPSSRVNAAA